jgi:2'-5' RNA ligase
MWQSDADRGVDAWLGPKHEELPMSERSSREGDSRDRRRRNAGGRGMRLFVAAYPPLELVECWRERLAALALPPHRMTPAEQVHLTLQFLGDTPEGELEAVVESMSRSCAGLATATLRATRFSALPTRGPARLIAIETDAPASLLELQRRLAGRLARRPRARPGSRYLPHLTLCRFRSPGRLKLAEGALSLAEAGPDAAAPFPLREVKLMRSVLGSAGAQHFEVATASLDAAD